MYQPVSLKVGTYWDLYQTKPFSDFKIKVYKRFVQEIYDQLIQLLYH